MSVTVTFLMSSLPGIVNADSESDSVVCRTTHRSSRTSVQFLDREDSSVRMVKGAPIYGVISM